MTVTQRLVIKFIVQMVLALSLLIFFCLIGLLILAFSILEQDEKEDFSKTPGDFLQQSISLHSGRLNVKENIEERILNQNGWFQIIDEEGKVQYSLNTPQNFPSAYSKQQIIEMISNQSKGKMLWSLEIENQSFIAIFYSQRTPDKILGIVRELMGNPLEEQLENQITKELSKEKANLYIYNDQNELLRQYITNKDLEEPSLFQIVDFQDNYWEKEVNISTHYDSELNISYVIIVPNKNFEEHLVSSININQTALKGLAITLIVLLIILFIISWWYAHKFGKPIIHIINWLQLLARGVYEEPLGKRKERAYSLKSNGYLKSSFKPFKEVILSLQKLTITLKENALQQKKIEQTREEWISGLTHDLKTPLSTIYGYAKMLNASNYDWTEEEVNDFYDSIEQNASYMSDLIEDINLTYRIKNNALPMYKEEVDINEFIREIVNQFLSTNVEKQHFYSVNVEDSPILYNVDKKYFKRIIVNLLINAAKYNPEGTSIKVSVNKVEDRFSIHVQDNGIGMDEYTKQNLFSRYYRGTSVKENTDGTGLGLAIAKQLIEIHDGTIKVETKVNKGTKITLIFHTQY